MAKAEVIVVDDEPATRNGLKEFLEAETGVQVVTAESGQEALRLMATRTPDLVIADFRMPGMDGLALLKECRRRDPGPRRVMITAYPDLEVATAAVNDAKVDAFVRKPLDPGPFARLVRGLVGGTGGSGKAERRAPA